MTLKLWRKAGEQFLDSNGNPLTIGALEYIETGTTNNINLYEDDQSSVVLTNPVLLNSSGRLISPIYINDALAFKEIITENSVTIEERDNYTLADGSGSSSVVFALHKSTVVDISDSITLTIANRGYEYNCDTGAVSELIIQLDAVTNWVNGHNFLVRMVSGGANVKILPAGADLINGLSELIVKPADQLVRVVSSGAGWVADKKIETEISVSAGLSGDGTVGAPIKIDLVSLQAEIDAEVDVRDYMQAIVRDVVAGPDIIITGERAQVDGGEASTANTLVKRYLNTIIQDRDSDAALDDSELTISRLGWCLIKWKAPGYECGTHQANLKDDTHSILYYGSSPVSGDGSGVSSTSEGVAKINITEETVFCLEHKSTVSSSTGYGVSPLFTSAVFSSMEVYFL